MAVVRQQHPTIERRERERHRERRRVGERVVPRGLVLHDVVGDAAEALGDLHRLAVLRAVAVHAERRLVGEVGRFDDQLFTLPVGTRVAQVLRNLLIDMRATVRVEETRVGQHLVAERDDAGSLHDAVAVAVDDAQDRAADAAGDAALIEREVVPGVERARAIGPAWHGATLHGGQNLGHASVGRIDEETRLREGAPRVVEPERALHARVASLGRGRDLCPADALRAASSRYRGGGPAGAACAGAACAGAAGAAPPRAPRPAPPRPPPPPASDMSASSLDHTPCRSGSPQHGAIYYSWGNTCSHGCVFIY